MPGANAICALLYLIIAISVCGSLAYTYLIQRAGPIVATSFAYVNPPLTVAMGIVFLHEGLTIRSATAIALVIIGSAIVIVDSLGG